MPIRVRDVELLVFPSVQLLDVAGPLQVFSSVNDMAVDAGRPAPYRLRVVAAQPECISASAGLNFRTEPLSRAAVSVDTLIIAGGRGVNGAIREPGVVEWLARRSQKARRVASVCTGAFLLAASGILDGKRATTHWAFCTELSRRYPQVKVEPDPIFLRDGSIWTSAGVTAGIDLALALVEEDLGRAVALEVARYLVVFLKRPGGQSQFSATLSLQAADDRFGALHDWMRANLGKELSLSVLAHKTNMSTRSFVRRYSLATGLTPARSVEKLRIQAAQRMLLESDFPTKQIARLCGLGSEETLRRSFLRLLGTTPQEYRARFGSAAAK